MTDNTLLGLIHLYDSETDTTTISWSYRDSPELDHFVLEVYDELSRQWRPYDNHMGIVYKDTH